MSRERLPSQGDWGELYPSSSDASELRRVVHVHGRYLEKMATKDDLSALRVDHTIFQTKIRATSATAIGVGSLLAGIIAALIAKLL